MGKDSGDFVEIEKSVLVVVDVQEKLFPHIDANELMASRIGRMMDFARLAGMPIVSCEQVKLGATVLPLGDKLPAKPHEKEAFSCFGSQDFSKELSGLGREMLIITGIETHVCVQQTTLDALKRNYSVQIVADAVSSRDPDNKRLALRRMGEAGAVITSSEAVIFELLRTAGHEKFREAIALVK